MSRRIEEFKTLFGTHARQLIDEASGRDTSPVKPPTLIDHVLEQTVLPEDTNDQEMLAAVVQNLAEKIAFHLRTRGQTAKKIRLEIHYVVGYNSSRIGQVHSPDDISVNRECKRLFTRANNRRVSVRAILLDVSQFRPYVEQKNFFSRPRSRDMEISMAIEMVRRKYAVDSIKTANVFHTLGSA